MIKMFNISDAPAGQIPEIGEMFRIGRDVGTCVGKTVDRGQIICMMQVEDDK